MLPIKRGQYQRPSLGIHGRRQSAPRSYYLNIIQKKKYYGTHARKWRRGDASMLKTGHMPCAIALQMIVLSFVSAQTSGLDFDPDESGFAPTTMDCDNTLEDSFCLDCFDDKARKKIWVSSDEIDNADGAQVYLYGLSDGDSGISDCMRIIINEGGENSAYEEFYPTLCFPALRYGWHYFWFGNLNCFNGDAWNTITIKGIGTDWTKEILWVGIDTTFPTGISSRCVDFQRSAWSHDTGQGWDLDYYHHIGELMIRVYFYKEDQGFYECCVA